MKTELLYLIYVTVLTGLLWIPYILERLAVQGLDEAIGYPDDPRPSSGWAVRLKKAHYNAVENLVVFAVLVLVAHALGISNGTIASASVWYFWARIVHAFAYTFAIPWVRTLAFAVGFFAQAVIAWQILP